MRYPCAALAIGAWAVLAAPGPRAALEQSLVAHALVQMPLLVAVGWLIGAAFRGGEKSAHGDWNRHGLAGALLAAFTVVFWLLPVSMDRAVQAWPWDLAKFLALPILAGVPLARSWWRLPVAGRALIHIQLIPMLVVMGWVYDVAPRRLCSSYRFDQQDTFAEALWLAAAGVAVLGVLRVLRGRAGGEQQATGPYD